MKPVLLICFCVFALNLRSVKAESTGSFQAEVMGKNATYLSNECKSCVDDGDTYCPSENFAHGFCCNATEVCPQATFCSDKFSKIHLKYALCPNEPAVCQHQRIL